MRLKFLSFTLGARIEQNLFSAELAAIAYILKTLVGLKDFRISLVTSNKAAAFTLKNPRQQSGQEFVYQIYKLIRRLHVRILGVCILICKYPELPIQHRSSRSAVSHRLLSDLTIISHLPLTSTFTMLFPSTNIHNLGYQAYPSLITPIMTSIMTSIFTCKGYTHFG